MFNFGTSTGQALYQSHTNIETSSGQALVPINKHIQTIENTKNKNKQQGFKKSNNQNQENGNKHDQTAFTERSRGIPYQDNLKTTTNKNYNEPL